MIYDAFKEVYFKRMPWGTVSRLLKTVGLPPDEICRANPTWKEVMDWDGRDGDHRYQAGLLSIRLLDVLQKDTQFAEVDPYGIFGYVFPMLTAFLKTEDFTQSDRLFIWKGERRLCRGCSQVSPTYLLYNRSTTAYCVEDDKTEQCVAVPAMMTALTLSSLIPQNATHPWRIGQESK